MDKYETYFEVTKDLLDTIKTGNLIKINDWNRPFKVVGVSENYFCMIRKVFGKVCYSVCEKKPWMGIRYNSMRGEMFHCGTDNMVFGAPCFDYKFDDPKQIKEYLGLFETGEIELSCRTSVPIRCISIK